VQLGGEQLRLRQQPLPAPLHRRVHRLLACLTASLQRRDTFRDAELKAGLRLLHALDLPVGEALERRRRHRLVVRGALGVQVREAR